ncbi:LytS/YhcK type 5TM receptor domain-containing protein [Lacrimispora sp. 210928-DFI.3.58]|uniref:LytS/YhcK type 5TM receptor domain-containing protein n=1 Tax=Lacrimispora sp. 210928-DFI.3.58 TaxID=2883214 RepID=UPI0015B43DB3|nr:LytS/YhcK type 5TM receptor domain-containing protein [Lacrimispora sp. 210928-DFI.3.58]MCB7317953.1 histidine kinase [Lacrimispora sp. 210928-DFI.3.58]
MADSIFLNMILNIGLLVLVAGVLTRIPVVRRLLLDESNSFLGKCALAVIFGLMSILSTYTGTSVAGAIVNTRVIGVLAAGLLGGPAVGIGAALIAGAHRYLFDIGGFTAVSCAVSTFAEGMLGALFSHYFRRGRWDNFGSFFLTAATEVIQMLIILCLARPFDQALALVKIIALPMILLNSIGMVVFIGTFNIVFVEDDNAAAGRIRLAFQLMEQSLPHLRKGLQSRPDMEAVAGIIFQSIKCSCVMITNKKEILALAANEKDRERFSFHGLPPHVQEAMEKKEALSCTFDDKKKPLYPALKNDVLVAAPLIQMEQTAGCLVLIAKRQWHSSNATVTFLKELSRLFSTQLELADLDYQRRQRKKAEYRALRSQINPHFLYNALNTIASVCREDPERSRALLRTLATYYRQTLENDRNIVSLATELFQVMNYLELEKARFEEKLQVEMEVPEDLHCMVPSFILQPLVENAIRHGADRRGYRYVKIRAEEQDGGVTICVSDHGPGFPPEVLRQLYEGEASETGRSIGLFNVHRRLKSIYGEEGGLRISSSQEGSEAAFLISPSPVADMLAEEYREAAAGTARS